MLYTVESTMESYSSLASGQNYTNIVLNVYKSDNQKIVMSSFENFNVNLRSFQQNPWMANIAGAPLWTQSGARLFFPRQGQNYIAQGLSIGELVLNFLRPC
jgi:hypothetical protein